MLGTVLLVFAFVLAVCAAASIPGASAPRVKLGWAALACYFASILFAGL